MHRGGLFAVGLAMLVTSGAQAGSGAALVGVLKDQQAIDGCSWSASSRSLGEAYMFLAEYDESVVIMNIGGKDIHLRLDPKQSTGSFGKVGSRLVQVYTAPAVRVEAAYTVIWACPEKDDSCEVTKFNVTFNVRSGGDSQVVQASGGVGC